jgi:hypothetical protein
MVYCAPLDQAKSDRRDEHRADLRDGYRSRVAPPLRQDDACARQTVPDEIEQRLFILEGGRVATVSVAYAPPPCRAFPLLQPEVNEEADLSLFDAVVAVHSALAERRWLLVLFGTIAHRRRAKRHGGISRAQPGRD